MTATSGAVLLSVAGGGPGGHVMDWSRGVVRAARARGLRVVVADLPANLAAVEPAPDVRTVPLDWRSVDATVALARALAPDGLAAVVGFREFSLEATAAAAAAVGLPWNPPEAVRLTRDKWRCRRRVAELGLRQPVSVPVTDLAGARAALAATGLPAVVKPRSAYGSQGVSVVHDADEVAAAFAAAAGFQPDVLVEEMVVGVELSAEGVLVGGEPVLLAVHRKRVAEGGSFVETGHRTADDLDEATSAELREVLRAALTGVGLTRSAFHVELWVTRDGIVLGEVHARTGGDWIHRLVELSSGVDVFGAVLDDVLGVADVPTGDPLGATGVGGAVSVLRGSPGRVRSLEGVAEVCEVPELVALDVVAGRGDVLGSEQESGDRPGLVVARSPHGTPAGRRGVAAQQVADALAGTVRFVTEAAAPAVPSR